MTRERLRTQAERQILATLGGQAWKRARWRELTPDETAEAVAALREIAAGRTDILAMATGIAESFAEDYDQDGEKDAAAAEWRCAALYREAGADPDLIPGWLEVYRQRRKRDRAAATREATARAREQDGK